MKKNSIKYIALIIFIVVGLFGIYYLTSKVVPTNKGDSNKTKKVKTTNDVVLYDGDEEFINKLISRLSTTSSMCYDVEYFANNKRVSVNDVTNDRAFNIVMRKLIDEARNSNKELESTMSIIEFRKYVSEVFGKDYKFDPNNLSSSGNGLVCGGYVFDSSSNMFIIPTFGGCGGSCGPVDTVFKVKSAILDGDILTVKVKVAFSNKNITSYEDNNQYYYFRDYERTQMIPTDLMLYDKLTDDGFNMASTYEYTFKNEDGNYVFVSSELVKD